MEKLTNDLRQSLDEIISQNQCDETNLMPMLLAAQDLNVNNYISEEVGTYIASKLDITPVRISAAISFFSALSTKKSGEHVIKLCRSTTCLINDYQSVRDILERELNIKMGETTDDYKFSLEYTECIGACDISPAFRIGKEVYGNLDESKIVDLLNRYKGV